LGFHQRRRSHPSSKEEVAQEGQFLLQCLFLPNLYLISVFWIDPNPLIEEEASVTEKP
jgi:hypothetical protein